MRAFDEPRAFDVAVIGGGASGLAAAISAARRGARVCVLERDVEAGLSILATGNGRCNISNASLESRRYRHPNIARQLFGAHPEQDIAAFFSSLGLMLAEESEGRLYPVTRRAESVRDVLLAACTRLGIELRCCCELTGAQHANGTWTLSLSEPERPLSYKQGHDAKARLRNARKAAAATKRVEHAVLAQSVIIACGGSSSDSCNLFGLPHIDERPVLCPIACELAYSEAPELAELDGFRVEAAIALVRKGAIYAFEEGEVLFRSYGISGIAAFNLSRRLQPGDLIQLDLFPALNDQRLHQLLIERSKVLGPFTGEPTWFDGMLARPLACALCNLLKSASQAANPLPACVSLLHRLTLHVTGTAECAQAQVKRGGIPFEAVDLNTLALSQHESLYACGEALDMDADCGGYNLAWAWLSGMRAGNAATSLSHHAQ